MSSLQDKVYLFFQDANLPEPHALSTAILAWQASKGYTSPSITANWMAIAQDIEVPYRGDLDMQNRVALGEYEVPDPEEE